MTGASTRAADVVALGVDRFREIDDEIGRAEQRPDPLSPRQPLRHEDEEPGERGGKQRRGEHSDLRLVELGSVEREIGDQDRDGEADPRDRPGAATDAQPTGGRSRPRLIFVASQLAPTIPIGLPST